MYIYICMCVYVRTSLSNGKFYIDLHIEGTDTSSYTDDIKKLLEIMVRKQKMMVRNQSKKL